MFHVNSGFLYGLAAIVILFVMAQSIFFLVRAYRQARAIGMDMKKIRSMILSIAIATSSIVTTIIITLGVLLFAQLEPVLSSDALAPAFDNILPSLFGGLAVVYVSKNWKISVAPLVFMIVLFILVPSLASSVGILVPVGALIAIGVARILYKKGII